MKQYSSNPRFNKAYFILATMAPDMVNDIVDLINSEGRVIVSRISSDESGPTKPYAVFSREYIPDEDFPAVFMGMTTIFLHSMKKLKWGIDDYEKVLSETFYIPDSMAKAAVKDIETIDIVGGTVASIAATPWYKLLSRRFQESVRRVVNWVPSALNIPWENDQAQDFDIDFLYEVKQLGEAVVRLQSRANLMKGQAMIAHDTGLFGGAPGSGDVWDSIGDPVDQWEVAIGDAMAKETGFLPLALLGGLKGLFKKGKAGHDAKVESMVNAAGLGRGGSASDPDAREAAGRFLRSQPGPIMATMSANEQRDALEKAVAVMQSVHDNMEAGDVEGHVRDSYGDAVADDWRNGNIQGAFGSIVELAGNGLDTTGDPELDETIIASVLNEVNGEIGDAEGAMDDEMGGLFKRARINRQLRKAARRQRKGEKRAAKQSSKNLQQAKLIAAREAAANAGQDVAVTSVDDYLAQIRAQSADLNTADPEINPALYPEGSSDFPGSDPFFMDLSDASV